MENTTDLICGLTATQIEALKAKHHFLFLVTVNDGQQDHQAVCTEPTLEIMQATKSVGATDEMKGSMVLYDNCVLAADEAIKNRFTLKSQVIKAISDKMASIKVTTKNF
jgi:hypothetical protein